MLWTLLMIAAAVAVDQWTKYLVVEHIKPLDTLPLIQDVLHLTYLENRGAAFGMLADHRWVFMILSTVSIIAVLFWLWKEKPKSWWIRTAAALIIGGGIGNMIDRVRLGYVVDFIDVRAIDFYVFNGADSFVCVGCAMIMLWVIRSEFLTKKKEEKEESVPEDGGTAQEPENKAESAAGGEDA